MDQSRGDPEIGGVGGGGGVMNADPPSVLESPASGRRGDGGGGGSLMTKMSSSTKRKSLLAIMGVCVAAAIAAAIAVPVSKHKRSNNVAAGTNSDSKGNDGSFDGTQVDTQNDDSNLKPTTVSDAGRPGPVQILPEGKNNRFNLRVQSFGSYVMEPYDSCDLLRDDVVAALKQLADDTISMNVDRFCDFFYGPMWPEGGGIMMTAAVDSPMIEGEMMDTGSAPNAAVNKEQSQGEDSYGTNNQVEGVDEADVVKSNGQFIFAAYGSDLVVIDVTTGEELDRITVDIEEEERIGDDEDEMHIVEEEGTEDVSGTASSSFIGIWPGPPMEPTRTIRSLLLDDSSKTVTAIMHYTTYDWKNPSIVGGGVTSAIAYSYEKMEVDVGRGAEDITGLEQTGSVDVTGDFSSARSIGSTAHIISNANINTYIFTRELDRCTAEFEDMSDDEYDLAAYETAKIAVAEFADRIMEELGLTDGVSCENIVQISSMTDEGNDDIQTERKLDPYDGAGVLDTFVQITSFDMSRGSLGTVEESVRKAGAFCPTGNSETYANNEFIVVAGRGYRREPDEDYYSWEEYTFLMSFEIQVRSGNDGGSSTSGVVQKAVGEVKGYLLDQFSMDYHRGYLRVATTNSAKWGTIVDHETGEKTWGTVVQSSSQVTNLLFVGGEMRVAGQLGDLGVTETIHSCRFMGDRGYVVTFRRTDPLYVLDMADDVPAVLGELKITGFSSYLHPIGDGKKYLLGIGQEAHEETGRTTGMKISLFDVSNPEDPREKSKYVLDTGGKGSSSSRAQWDHHAFRYLEVSKKLILPVSRWSWNWQSEDSADNFDGFMLYDVDVEADGGGITPAGNVTHADAEKIAGKTWCWGRASFPPRSMVFQGDLVTLKGHSVRMSKGLDTLEKEWTVDLDLNRDPEKDVCYRYFLF